MLVHGNHSNAHFPADDQTQIVLYRELQFLKVIINAEEPSQFQEITERLGEKKKLKPGTDGQ